MVAPYKLAEQVEHYKTNLNGEHFTLKPTITVNTKWHCLSSEKKYYKNRY